MKGCIWCEKVCLFSFLISEHPQGGPRSSDITGLVDEITCKKCLVLIVLRSLGVLYKSCTNLLRTIVNSVEKS